MTISEESGQVAKGIGNFMISKEWLSVLSLVAQPKHVNLHNLRVLEYGGDVAVQIWNEKGIRKQLILGCHIA